MTATSAVGATTEAPTRRGFRTDVQGLRAIAVGLVLLYHAGLPVIAGGYIGVDVFFVISGFLISSHLLESIERTGRVHLADFYARRIRRILPASLTVALFTAVAAVLFFPPLALERVLKDALATILYVPNVWFAAQNTDYLADHSPSPYQHYWSLGVEEQFYLFWPVILVAIVLLVRRRRSLAIIAIAVITLASFVLGVVLTLLNQPAAFFLLPTRAWELLAGALVGALLLHRTPRIPAWLAAIGGWVGIALILACAVLYNDQTVFPGTAALLPTLGTALVIYFGAIPAAAGPGSALSIRAMQFIGLISYSLYLVHWPLLVVTQAAVGEQSPLRLSIKVLLGIVLAVPLAWLLFRFVETPMRAPRTLTTRRPLVTLLGTLAVTVVIALGLGAATAWSSTREVSSGPEVSAAPSAPTAPPNATAFVPRNLTPALAGVSEDLPPMYADGCHHDVTREDVQDCRYGNPNGDTVVALFGDSHSAQWFPAMSEWAESNPAVAIDTYTKSSCPAVDTTVLDKGVPYASCDRWRHAVIAQLVAEPPAVVVISNYSAYALPDVTGADRAAVWSDGIASMVAQLEAAGSEVLVISDTPRFASPPPICVSANTEDVNVCAGARAEVLDSDFAEAERDGVKQAGGTAADLTDYICGVDTCPAIVDNLLVYRDVNHLTTPFVSYLTPVLVPVLDGLVNEETHTGP